MVLNTFYTQNMKWFVENMYSHKLNDSKNKTTPLWWQEQTANVSLVNVVHMQGVSIADWLVVKEEHIQYIIRTVLGQTSITCEADSVAICISTVIVVT